MTARSMWNGSLQLAEHSLPVKVYAAVQDVAVHFNLLHDSDLTRLKQRWVTAPANDQQPDGDSVSEAVSPRVQKGYPLNDGSYVVLQDTELEALVPAASRSIELRAFVPLSAIDPVWYLRPYYLGPNTLEEDYFALAQVLQERKLAGIAHWVMRKRAYHGALLASDGHLLLHTLRNREEVLVAPKVIAPSRAFDAREVKMADQLIDALFGQFDPAAFHDEHRQRVLELIEKKAAGQPTKHSVPKAPKVDDAPLVDALERSLRALAKTQHEPGAGSSEKRSATQKRSTTDKRSAKERRSA